MDRAVRWSNDNITALSTGFDEHFLFFVLGQFSVARDLGAPPEPMVSPGASLEITLFDPVDELREPCLSSSFDILVVGWAPIEIQALQVSAD